MRENEPGRERKELKGERERENGAYRIINLILFMYNSSYAPSIIMVVFEVFFNWVMITQDGSTTNACKHVHH